MLFTEESKNLWDIASNNTNDTDFVYCRKIIGADTLTFDVKGDWSSVDIVGKFKLKFNNHTYSYDKNTNTWSDEKGVVCNDVSMTDENGNAVNFVEYAKYDSGYKWTTVTISNITTHLEIQLMASAAPSYILPMYVRNFVWINSEYVA